MSSLQNILEVAKKLGVPVIITDQAGEAAQVVLSFEQFVAMSGVNVPEAPFSKPVEQRVASEPAVVNIPIQVTPTVQSIPNSNSSSPEKPQISEEMFVEERFYIEPLDPEQN